MKMGEQGIIENLRSLSSNIDPRDRIRRLAFAITRAVGSPTSIIVHSILFGVSFFAAYDGWISWDRMLLILTTIVSLEAIYLSIFIQMTINFTTEDIEEIQEDVGEIQEDVGELQEDVEEISEDVEDISEDVEEITEEEAVDEAAEEVRKSEQKKTLVDIQTDLRRLMADIQKLQQPTKEDSSTKII